MNYLKTSLFSFVLCALAQSVSARKPPNILFLLTDDQRADTLSISGHPVVKTPNLDTLAAQGIRFTQAFSCNPICMPSRISFLSGLYERVHGVGFSSERSVSRELWDQTYPQILRRNGYYTGFIGKLGVERYPYNKGRQSETFDFWCGHDGWASFFPKDKKSTAKQLKKDPDAKSNCFSYVGLKSDIITPMMGEAFENFLNQDHGSKPFCLSVSFSAPHGSISGTMIKDEPHGKRMQRAAHSTPELKDHPIYGNLYRNAGIQIPEETARGSERHIPTDVLTHEGRKKTYSFSYNRKTCLEHHIRYYQLITGVDHVVGQMIESLKKRGLFENTIIIYSSDHGLLMGEYGIGGKALAYELSAKIPFIVYDPSLPQEQRGTVSDALVLNVDVAPTLLAYAGLPAPAVCQGKSLLPLLQNPEISWRNHVFIENLFTGRNTPLVEAVRSKRWKYVRYFRRKGAWNEVVEPGFPKREPLFEQLFDLENDPRERVNLTSTHPEVLEKLRSLCRKESRQQIELWHDVQK